MEKLKKYVFALISLPLIAFCLQGQNLIKNELIIKGENLRWENLVQNADRESVSWFHEEICSDLNLHWLVSDKEFMQVDLNFIKDRLGAEEIFYNQAIEERKRPNDLFFGAQTYLNLIQIPKVWNITTGGKMQNGSEIVAVVLDTGIEIDHPDLVNNIFVNTQEIPNDFLDNDGNGYIDDVNGLNTISNLGNHVVERHGTWVSGIIGAEGNNNVGVSGVNWHVKILPITNVRNLATVIKGYDYALNMKKLYIQSQGTRGANIVVTNYSGGLDKAFGSDPAYKPWCDMYDLLGAQGILSVGSTTNTEVDVDEVGDMPSTCSSEFFIAVTSIDSLGLFSRNVGFGSDNIDLAAPGENIFNLRNGSSYFDDTGTSASSPMVAGTIALLYSVPCVSFGQLVEQDRIKAARYVRDAIFNGVSPTDELKSRSKSGGYLNAFNALLNMQEACNGELPIPTQTGQLKLESVTYANGLLRLKYQTPTTGKHSFGLYDASGKLIRFFDYEIPAFGDNTFEIDGLDLLQGVYYVNLISDKSNTAKAVFVW